MIREARREADAASRATAVVVLLMLLNREGSVRPAFHAAACRSCTR
jgi:hypothetical protein